ncbi:hypothetical protein SNE40_001885 [Patella caerulea]|uniref:Calmodulin n=1 Tax=Patella caerulea TaxID=87958 RepID=A0AAN8PYD3_PATCE
MKVFVLIAAVLGCCLALPCLHDNAHDLTEEHVINMVVVALDTDGDGVISEIDILNYFIVNFDHNFDFQVDSGEFVKQWHATFHDSEAFALHVFQQLNTNPDNVLSLADVDPLVMRVDTSGDGLIQNDEFKQQLELIYAAC